MVCDKLLDHNQGLVLKQLCLFWQDFLDVLKVVLTDVLVPDVLENFTRQFSEFVTRGVDEMAKVAASAACGPVVVAAGNRAVVACLYNLVRIWRGVCSELGCLDLVLVLEALHLLVRHPD